MIKSSELDIHPSALPLQPRGPNRYFEIIKSNVESVVSTIIIKRMSKALMTLIMTWRCKHFMDDKGQNLR